MEMVARTGKPTSGADDVVVLCDGMGVLYQLELERWPERKAVDRKRGRIIDTHRKDMDGMKGE